MNLFEMFLLALAGAVTFALLIVFFVSFWWHIILFLGMGWLIQCLTKKNEL